MRYLRSDATTTAVNVVPSARAFLTAGIHTSSGIRSERGIVATSDRLRDDLNLADDRVVREVHGRVVGRAVSETERRSSLRVDHRGQREGRADLRGVDLADGAVAGDSDGVLKGAARGCHVDTVSRLYLQRNPFAGTTFGSAS